MKEFLDIFRYFADAVSFLWKKAETDNERQIKILNYALLALVIFIVGWCSFVLVKKQQLLFSARPEIVQLPYVPSTNLPTNLFDGQFHSSALRVLNSNATIPLVISKKAVTNQFYYGETVEVKSFAVYGIIHEKTLGPYGYVYTVRYKDNSHALHDVDCYTDEIVRPSPGSLPPSALIN